MMDYEKLEEYKKLKDDGVISEEEFQAVKSELLNNTAYDENKLDNQNLNSDTTQETNEPKYKPQFEKMRQIFSIISVILGNIGFYTCIIGGFGLLGILIAGVSGSQHLSASFGTISIISMIYFVVTPAITLGINGIILSKIAMRTPTYYNKARFGLNRSILSIVLGVIILIVFIIFLTLRLTAVYR